MGFVSIVKILIFIRMTVMFPGGYLGNGHGYPGSVLRKEN
jgi:hypothetical protein